MAVKSPAYLIVGKGRWGSKMHGMIDREGRRVGVAENIRRASTESSEAYESRIAQAFAASGAQIAWLCVPPGSHVPPLIRCAIQARLHVIVEKPWTYSRAETLALQDAARQAHLQTAVDFEFCLLSEIENWRRQLHQRQDLTFNGTFAVSAENHLKIPAMQNLGSHLLAIHQYAVPQSTVSAIRCDYQSADQRKVSLHAERNDSPRSISWEARSRFSSASSPNLKAASQAHHSRSTLTLPEK